MMPCRYSLQGLSLAGHLANLVWPKVINLRVKLLEPTPEQQYATIIFGFDIFVQILRNENSDSAADHYMLLRK